jgi:1,4-alpha-glucan branching enzyme
VLARLDLRAPAATQVAVAGDFNGWRPEATPLRRGEGGVWTVQLPLAPGKRYEYMFVVDGAWVADPSAPATSDDGFGGANAVLEL